MPLITGDVFADDPFAMVADEAPLPDTGGAIVSLLRFRKDRDVLLGRNTPIGVRLTSDQSPEELGADVHRLSVVIIEFPKFRDGRGFSWARMLRTRLGFKGQIRAAGDFLYDQIAFLHRTGFDAFEVAEGFSLEQFRLALGEMREVYQPSADGKKTIRELRTRR